LIYANPKALIDPGKQAAIVDFLCRLNRAQRWREQNLETWAATYSKEINVDGAIVLREAKEGLVKTYISIFIKSSFDGSVHGLISFN
jgi:sulfonate transport system substrate-binding protein